jgi:very-short-patch-repair endonuclease
MQRFKNVINRTTRVLRRRSTEAEEMLWLLVRNRQILDKKFLRQYPIIFKLNGKRRFFVADFYCHENRLIVELDGEIHEKRKNYDKMRDDILKTLGYQIIRIKNDELIEDPSGTVEKLKLVINLPLSGKRGERGELREIS